MTVGADGMPVLRLERPSKIQKLEPRPLKLTLDLGSQIHVSNAAKLSLKSRKRAAAPQPTRPPRLHLNRETRIHFGLPTIQQYTEHAWDIINERLGLESQKEEEEIGFSNSRAALIAAQCVVLGLETEFLQWDAGRMQYKKKQSSTADVFSDCLLQLSASGSHIRRLLAAAQDIRVKTQSSCAPLSLLAIVAIIEREVLGLQRELTLAEPARGFARFTYETEEARSSVHELAALIGCDDLAHSGRLERVPTAVELLERAFQRASSLDSDVLWRVTAAAMKPWLEQLNFVLGIEDMHTPRTPELKAWRFPELFIDVTDDHVWLDPLQVPSFLPLSLAEAVSECYKLLCFTNNVVLPTRVSPITFTSSEALPPRLTLSRSTPTTLPPPLNATKRIAFERILHRRYELNILAKEHLLLQLEPILEIIIGLYLLQNGRFWSLLVDLVPQLDNAAKPQYAVLGKIQDLVDQEFGSSFLVRLDPDLRIDYNVPPVGQAVLSAGLWPRLQLVFTSLLALSDSPAELATYSAEIDAAVERITAAKRESGLLELLAALETIP